MIPEIAAATRYFGEKRNAASGGGPDHSGTEHIQFMESFSRGTFPELTEKVGPLQKRYNHFDRVENLNEVGWFILAKSVPTVLTEREVRREKTRHVLAECARKRDTILKSDLMNRAA